MPIAPIGTPISNVPNVFVQIVPPKPILSGVATNLIGYVGIASWGPKNAPTYGGGINDYITRFGTPLAAQYDMGTAVYFAGLQGANSFVCVRVTDGTDTAATTTLLDASSTPIAGAYLNAIYTGTTGNTLNATISKGSSYTAAVPTWKVVLYLTGGIPETFDNIGGTANVFWQNLVTAINNGQSVARGPSQLVTATLGSGVGAATIVSGGTGYVVGNILTVSGGTSTTAAQITVDTVDGSGVILTSHVSRTGVYSVFPTNPASVTGGAGSGATFTLTQGAQASPAQSTYTFSGGTNGNAAITTATLIGVDGTNRTGMYALRNSKANIVMLVDATDPTYWTNQVAFGYSEGIAYMIGTVAPGYQDNIAGAVTLKQTNGIDAYDFKLMTGDWCQINDIFNGVTRFISAQSFVAGILAVTRADGSSLNKPINGIIATQKSLENRTYSDSDLSQLYSGGLDVITLGIPVSASAFGVRLGINTSSNNQTNTDNYPRMVNFLGNTILNGMTPYVGLTQTPDTRLQAKNAIQSFLSVLASDTLSGGPMIGDVNNPGSLSAAFKVILDATNNPSTQVALGFMQCNVQVVLFSIIQYLVVNLDAAQNITIQVLPPQANTGV